MQDSGDHFMKNHILQHVGQKIIDLSEANRPLHAVVGIDTKFRMHTCLSAIAHNSVDINSFVKANVW